MTSTRRGSLLRRSARRQPNNAPAHNDYIPAFHLAIVEQERNQPEARRETDYNLGNHFGFVNVYNVTMVASYVCGCLSQGHWALVITT